MSRDFNDISKRIDQSNKDLHKEESELVKALIVLNKDQEKSTKDISGIKKQIKDISNKIDLILDILQNFTIMLEEEEEELEDEEYYDNDSSWTPDDNEWESSEDFDE